MTELINWDSVKVIKILNIDWNIKYIALLIQLKSEKHPEGAESVLLAHKSGFDNANDLTTLLSPASSHQVNQHAITVDLLDHNDIYYRYTISINGFLHSKLQLIHPATAVHIAKYTKQERLFIAETPQIYQSIVLPYIERLASSRIKWIDNILSGVSEQDRIVVCRDGDDGFVVVPDSKWDQKSISALYLLCIVRRKDIRTIRDLTAEHLPILKAIRDDVKNSVSVKYPQVLPQQLRFYVHYLPTYYYFHIHIVHVDYESAGCSVGAAHLLDDVIDNIENIDPLYYVKKTMNYTLGKEHELYSIIQGRST